MGEIKSGSTDTIRISEQVMTGYVLEVPVKGKKILGFKKESDSTKCGMLVTKSFQLEATNIQTLDTHVWSVWSAETNCTYILQLIKEEKCNEKVVVGNIIERPNQGSTVKVLVWTTCAYGFKCDETLKVQVEQLRILSENVFHIVSDDGTQYIVETV